MSEASVLAISCCAALGGSDEYFVRMTNQALVPNISCATLEGSNELFLRMDASLQRSRSAAGNLCCIQ